MRQLASAAMKTVLWAGLLHLCLAPAVAGASAAPAPEPADQLLRRLQADFPPGSIATRDTADRALAAAQQAHAQLQREYEARSVYCSNVFFVNRCMDAARRTQRAGEHIVHGVTLEAHDLQRHLDGVAHAQSREQAARQQAADELLRPEREREAMASARMREDNAAAREQDEQRDLAKAAQDSAAKLEQARQQALDQARKDALRPGQEAVALRDFQEKQRQAADYAKTRAQDREANAKRRNEREAARAAEAAADHPGGTAKP